MKSVTNLADRGAEPVQKVTAAPVGLELADQRALIPGMAALEAAVAALCTVYAIQGGKSRCWMAITFAYMLALAYFASLITYNVTALFYKALPSRDSRTRLSNLGRRARRTEGPSGHANSALRSYNDLT